MSKQKVLSILVEQSTLFLFHKNEVFNHLYPIAVDQG
jgi:hypothetical protein